MGAGEIEGDMPPRDPHRGQDDRPAKLLAGLRSFRARLDELPWTVEDLPTPAMLTMLRQLDRLIEQAETIAGLEWGDSHMHIVDEIGVFKIRAALNALLCHVEKELWGGDDAP